MKRVRRVGRGLEKGIWINQSEVLDMYIDIMGVYKSNLEEKKINKK